MKNTRVKKKLNSVNKRLIIYIAISFVTLSIIIPLACFVNINDNKVEWINIFIDLLLAFFSGSIFAIIVDIIPFYIEKKRCKNSLANLIKSCQKELQDIENYDAKQFVLDKYFEIFRDFFLIQSGIMGKASFECLKDLDNIKIKKITSLEPTFSQKHLNEIQTIFNNWLEFI